MTIRQGIKNIGLPAVVSVVQEILQLQEKDTFTGVIIKDLSEEQLKRLITSSMFLKEKFSADGNFEKLKARLVAGGHMQDRDELLYEEFLYNLPQILRDNPEVQLFCLPRINTVEGLTEEHIQKWDWNVNEKGWINWPDYQWRIYLNTSRISWKNKVHEVLNGFTHYAPLPMYVDYALYHPKTIERQEKQNSYYDTL